MPNLEKEFFSKPEPWKGNENVSLPYTGYGGPPVQCRDLASGTSRDQETEDVSNAVCVRHPWAHTVRQTKKCIRIGLETVRVSARGGAAEVKTTAVAGPCAADA